MDLEGWIWSFFVNPFSFTVLCDDLGCFWFWCTGCVWSPLNRFCSWALVLLIFPAEWFSSDDHHDQCFDEWTNLFLISGYNVTQRCTNVKQVSFLCVVRCFFVMDFACVPICVSKVFFFWVGCSDYSVNFWSTTFGGCGVLVLLGKAASFNGVALQSTGANRHNRFNRGITFHGGGPFIHRCQSTCGQVVRFRKDSVVFLSRFDWLMVVYIAETRENAGRVFLPFWLGLLWWCLVV